MIGRPVAERSRRSTADLRDRGCHERRLTDCRTPGTEQHIHHKSRHESEQLFSRLIWRHLFYEQRAADHSTDYRYLLELAQGLRPGQNIFRSRMSVLTQGADRDRGDVTLVDRCRRSSEIRPAHDIAGTNLRRPPAQGVSGEHSGPHERPLASCGFDQPLDFRVQRRDRIGLPALEEGVRRFVRR